MFRPAIGDQHISVGQFAHVLICAKPRRQKSWIMQMPAFGKNLDNLDRQYGSGLNPRPKDIVVTSDGSDLQPIERVSLAPDEGEISKDFAGMVRARSGIDHWRPHGGCQFAQV